MLWRINQNHGCYRFGSSYPTQKRLQIIVTFLETLSIANTSRIRRVSYNCVDQYVRLFQQRATLIPSVCNNVRPRQMTWWKAAFLEALVRMYPTLYLRELQQILASDFHLAPGDVPSIASVVYRVANKYHLILSGLFSNFKAPTIKNKLLLSLVFYVGSFKIRK